MYDVKQVGQSMKLGFGNFLSKIQGIAPRYEVLLITLARLVGHLRLLVAGGLKAALLRELTNIAP